MKQTPVIVESQDELVKLVDELKKNNYEVYGSLNNVKAICIDEDKQKVFKISSSSLAYYGINKEVINCKEALDMFINKEDKIIKEENVFQELLGYDAEKRELLLIRRWFLDESLINNKNVTLPSGIIFFGDHGCGKTLLLREYSKSFGCPVYVIEGKEENICEEIHSIFNKARKEKLAIVLIDEIDLLIGKDMLVERTLQQELDGINQNGKIIVMATTNHLNRLSLELRRAGRIDREFKIDKPDKNARELIFKTVISDLCQDNEIDFAHIARITESCNGADIKAICNDAYLRSNGKITTDDLESSYERVKNKEYHNNNFKKSYQIAIHEIGHMLMCLHYKKYFSFYSAKLNETGGIVESYDVDEDYDDRNKRIATIKIALAGYVAEEIFYKKPNIGSYSDLERAFDLAERLITHSCVNGINTFVQHYSDNTTYLASEKRRFKNEKLINKMLTKLKKEVYWYLIKNKKLIKLYADELFNKTKLYYKDILEA